MTRRIAVGLSALILLPLLLLGSSSGPGPAFASPVAFAGGSDDQQVAALTEPERSAVLAAARTHALPPALLAAIASANPDATARQLLAAGAINGGAWDADLALAQTREPAQVQQILDTAGSYGYRYSPTGPPLDPSRYVFPLHGAVSYGPYHHDYPATDIFVPIGTPVLACVRADVLRLSRTDSGKGGLSITLRGEDGWRYYYAHLSVVVTPLAPGQIVEPGQLLGASGDTGDAHGTDPHLHFGISRTGSAQGQLLPYPYLQAWPRV